MLRNSKIQNLHTFTIKEKNERELHAYKITLYLYT